MANDLKNVKVGFIGARQAGIIGLLAVLSQKVNVLGLVYYEDIIKELACLLGIPIFSSIKDERFQELLKECDLLISVHGREIVSKKILSLPKYGGINAHPCLYKYKGADPIGRLLEDKNEKGSVAVHFMTGSVDEGEVICEQFIDVGRCSTREEIYNKLYPLYAKVIIEALRRLVQKNE